jgi:integrase
MRVLSTIEDGLKDHFLDLTNNRTIIRLDAHVEGWLATMGHIHPRTILERRTVAQKLTEWLTKNGAVDVRKVTRDHARSFVASLTGAASTVNKAIQTPVALWRYLKEEGVDVDPAIWEKLGPKKTRAEMNTDLERPFSLQELQTLFSKDNLSGLRADLRDAMSISLFSGMRLSEVGELRVGDIDLDKDAITIRGTKTARALRTIPLHHRLKSLLMARSEGKDSKDYILHELDGEGLHASRHRRVAAL